MASLVPAPTAAPDALSDTTWPTKLGQPCQAQYRFLRSQEAGVHQLCPGAIVEGWCR